MTKQNSADDLETLGGRIRYLRERRRETRAEAGESLGIAPSKIARCEQVPDTSPKSDLLEALLRRWDVNLNWLVTGEGHPYVSGSQGGCIDFSGPGEDAKDGFLPAWVFGRWKAGLNAYVVDIANPAESIMQGDLALVARGHQEPIAKSTAELDGALFLVGRYGSRSVRRVTQDRDGMLRTTDELGISYWTCPITAWPTQLKLMGRVIGIIRATAEAPSDKDTD